MRSLPLAADHLAGWAAQTGPHPGAGQPALACRSAACCLRPEALVESSQTPHHQTPPGDTRRPAQELAGTEEQRRTLGSAADSRPQPEGAAHTPGEVLPRTAVARTLAQAQGGMYSPWQPARHMQPVDWGWALELDTLVLGRVQELDTSRERALGTQERVLGSTPAEAPAEAEHEL